jgi:hypothetical protein
MKKWRAAVLRVRLPSAPLAIRRGGRPSRAALALFRRDDRRSGAASAREGLMPAGPNRSGHVDLPPVRSTTWRDAGGITTKQPSRGSPWRAARQASLTRRERQGVRAAEEATLINCYAFGSAQLRSRGGSLRSSGEGVMRVVLLPRRHAGECRGGDRPPASLHALPGPPTRHSAVSSEILAASRYAQPRLAAAEARVAVKAGPRRGAPNAPHSARVGGGGTLEGEH